MLAGSPPYPAASPQEAIARHLKDPIPSVRRAAGDVPPALEGAVSRALAKQPGDRFPTAAAFASALAGALEPEGQRSWWQLWKG